MFLSEECRWGCPQGTAALHTFINYHDYIAKGFEAEFFRVECPSCCPPDSITALETQLKVIFQLLHYIMAVNGAILSIIIYTFIHTM